jgi:hypothetical protein
MNAPSPRPSSSLTVSAVVALLVGLVLHSQAQIPAIPEPPILLYGTVTDKTNNQPVTITSVTWQVTDGTTTRGYSAATLPTTRIISNGQSFYLLQVPQETRVVQNGAGQITLQPSGSGFEVKSLAPTHTLTATINGIPSTMKTVDSTNQPTGTASATISGYTPATQGRMMRVDLWINEDPYLAWAAGYFQDPAASGSAANADPDGDGATNRQEWAAGTHPLDAQSRLMITDAILREDGAIVLQAATVPGRRYQLESSADLVTFSNDGAPFAATAVRSQLTPSPGGARRFYRLKALPD